MRIELADLRTRLRAQVELEGAILTEDEVSHVAESYARCGGIGHWDVRAYARVAAAGAREYRVVRGSSVQDVFCSVDRDRATAVRTALNELESLLDRERIV
jgi:hypothetical protein